MTDDNLEELMNPFKADYVKTHNTYRDLMAYLNTIEGATEVKERGWELGVFVYDCNDAELKTVQAIEDARDDALQPFTTFWLPDPSSVVDFYPGVMRELFTKLRPNKLYRDTQLNDHILDAMRLAQQQHLSSAPTATQQQLIDQLNNNKYNPPGMIPRNKQGGTW